MAAADQPASAVDPAPTASASTSELVARLDQLKASATQQYSLKNYNAAAEFYSEAAEVQDLLHGEMSPENADLLYQYGRCLYHVAVANSDVLGGKVASTEEPKRKKRKVAPVEGSAPSAKEEEGSGMISDALKDAEQKLAEEVVEAVVEEKDGVKKAEPSSKPFFQITGDENFTDSEDDDDDAADAEAEEEEDDFATAFEILDVARILLSRKLQALQEAAGKQVLETPEQRLLKERLADTHDLQAEISLENERFHDAIKDTRDALELKLQLYPQESSLIAEAHFKLSLALEFASVTSTTEDGDGESADAGKPAQVDQAMRAEAAGEMEKAIASCKLRVEKETASLDNLLDSSVHQKSIADVKEMVADMEQRLLDLRNPAISLSGPTGPAGAPDDADPVRGILGDLLGESKAEQAKRIQAATEGANDLSGLVKRGKKAKVPVDAGDSADVGKGKRKMGDVDGEGDGEVGFGNGNGHGKKVKFENGV